MALDGILFDLDGTLVASNSAHVEAWVQAFSRFGYLVGRDRIADEIGKGGDQLVPSILGCIADRQDGEALREEQGKAFARIAPAQGLKPAPQAEALLAELHARGLRTALATSAGPDQIEVVERSSGVAWRKLFDFVVDAGDVSASKPQPDIVNAALHKLNLTAAQCAMVGDTPWDALAARRAGVALIGLTYGGNSAERLSRNGARMVLADTAAVLAQMEEVLARASPGSARLDARALDRLMREALTVAEDALRAHEVPIGCVIARGDGVIVSRAHNRHNETGLSVAHAEMEALRASAGKLDPRARDTIMVSTLEPCVMCTGAAMETAVDVVIFGLEAHSDGGSRRVCAPLSVENQVCRIVGGILAKESRALFERWRRSPGRNREQEPYVTQLLGEQDGALIEVTRRDEPAFQPSYTLSR
ncbi:MAG: HAD-IA family hydrolase [Minicystis sp.]